MYKAGKINTDFKKRYFILTTDGRLIYYEKPDAPKPNGECDIVNMQKDITTKKFGKDGWNYGFTVHTKKKKEREWRFSCQTEKERNEWIQQIKLADKLNCIIM